MTRSTLVSIALAGLAACESAEPIGTVSIALGQDQCDDYCLDTLRATLFAEGVPDLPIGPPMQVACGEEITFAALPAGERVLVTLTAFDVTGDVLLEGTSEPLTIIADGVAEATIRLVERARPVVETVEPNPVVVADRPATITLGGAFGPALGAAAVEVGDVAFGDDAWDWGARGETISLTLPAGAKGGPVVVRACGIRSEPFDYRVIGPAPGEATVTPWPGCDEATAIAPVSDGALVAWRCGEAGVLARMRQNETVCPLDPGESWSLAVAPDALATDGVYALVGGAGWIAEIDLTSSAMVEATYPEEFLALTWVPSGPFGLVREGGKTRLVRLHAPGMADVAGIDADLTLTALAGNSGSLFVAAHAGDGEGRLVEVRSSGVPATYSLVRDALACPRPRALAVNGAETTAVIGCGDGDLAVWDIAGSSFEIVDLDEPADTLAFDVFDDVVYALTASGLAIVDRDESAVVHRFGRPPRPDGRRPVLASLLAHNVVVADGTAPLVMLTPFDAAGPCAAVAP